MVTHSTPQSQRQLHARKTKEIIKNECLHEGKERAGVMVDSTMRRGKGALSVYGDDVPGAPHFLVACAGAWTALRDLNHHQIDDMVPESRPCPRVCFILQSWPAFTGEQPLRLSRCAFCVVSIPNSSSWTFAPPLRRSVWQGARPTTHRCPNALPSPPHCATPYLPCVSSCVASCSPYTSHLHSFDAKTYIST